MRFRILVILVGIVFAAVYTTEGFLFRDYNEDEFQVASGYLKDQQDALYQRDFIWSKADMVRNLHVCVRGFMRVTEWITFGVFKEPIDLFLVWLPMCVFLFFVGNYLLCLRFTGNSLASLLIACSFMLVRRTIWDWWGVGPIFTMSARGLALSLLPLALWAYFQCRGHLGYLAGWFFLWGLVSNLHPLSGWGFVELLGVTILVSEHFSSRALTKVVVIGIATLIGSIPFLWMWSRVVMIPPELQADPAIVKKFWDSFMGLELPRAIFIRQFLMDLAIPLLLAVGGFIFWCRKGRRGDLYEMRLLYLFPAVVILMTLLVMVLGSVLRYAGVSLPVMVPEHGRNIKMIYLILPVWMAFGVVGWLRSSVSTSVWWRYGPVMIVLFFSMIINFPGHKLARSVLAKVGLLSATSFQRLLEVRREDAADLEVALWARKHTPVDALFYFDSYEFRYYARRSLVFCWFDRPCVAFRPARELEEWLRRRDRLKPLKDVQDGSGMLIVARDYGAQFLVVLNTWKQPEGKTVWSNWKYSVYEVSGEL